VELLFKAKMRVVFTDAIATEALKSKIDAIKIDLDSEKKDVLTISGSEIINDRTITCIAIVLSKTDKTYNLTTYIEKIRTHIAAATQNDSLKLIDIQII
jgi:hypothetical protein